MIQTILPRTTSAAVTLDFEQLQQIAPSFVPSGQSAPAYYDSLEEDHYRINFEDPEEIARLTADDIEIEDPISLDAQATAEDLELQPADAVDLEGFEEADNQSARAFEEPLEHSPEEMTPAFAAEPDNGDERPQALAVDDAKAIDPWDDPLPAWDFSRNEWPMMVGVTPANQLSRLRAPLVLILSLAACGLAYYFISQFWNGAGENRSTIARIERDKAAAGGALPQAEAAAAVASGSSSGVKEVTEKEAPSPPASDTTSGGEQKQAGSLPSAEAASGRGAFSLQAASFPTEAGANDFSQKLMTSGIQAYVIPVEIAGRGRWFRVRVGRFSTAEEAKRHAAESRQRARAAGMNIDLIVCDYQGN